MAGMTVERGRLCKCKKRFFNQSLLSPDYLDALRPAQSKLYVDSACEIELVSPQIYRIWTPNCCPECLRGEMTTYTGKTL